MKMPKTKFERQVWREKLGGRLQEARNNLKLNRKQVCKDKEVNFSESILSYYERGTKNPSAEYLARLANFYGVTVSWLLGETTDKNASADIMAVEKELGLTYESQVTLAMIKRNCDVVGFDGKEIKKGNAIKEAYRKRLDAVNAFLSHGEFIETIAKMTVEYLDSLNQIKTLNKELNELDNDAYNLPDMPRDSKECIDFRKRYVAVEKKLSDMTLMRDVNLYHISKLTVAMIERLGEKQDKEAANAKKN